MSKDHRNQFKVYLRQFEHQKEDNGSGQLTHIKSEKLLIYNFVQRRKANKNVEAYYAIMLPLLTNLLYC